MESLSIWKSSWWLHYQAVSGEGGSSPGPGWCYPWDQDTEESPSVTTTLFALYLRILLYNKFDVAKPSDHITTIKLIPPSYSGGPSPQSVSRLTNNQLTQLGEKLFSSCFLSNTVDSSASQCFCFPLEKDGAIVFVPVLTRSEFADFYNARVNGTLHCSTPLNTRHQAAFACLIFNDQAVSYIIALTRRLTAVDFYEGFPWLGHNISQ